MIRICCTEDREKWTFSVQDNGIGMDMDHSDRIFQMFQRLHTPGKYPGTGVGLAIVEEDRGAARGQGVGGVEEGDGSTFFFTIPKEVKI